MGSPRLISGIPEARRLDCDLGLGYRVGSLLIGERNRAGFWRHVLHSACQHITVQDITNSCFYCGLYNYVSLRVVRGLPVARLLLVALGASGFKHFPLPRSKISGRMFWVSQAHQAKRRTTSTQLLRPLLGIRSDMIQARGKTITCKLKILKVSLGLFGKLLRAKCKSGAGIG